MSGPRSKVLHAAALAAGMSAGSAESRAVLVYVNDTTATRNTSAPTGPLANSGWQYQGHFGLVLGTAIAPQHFVTAKHVIPTVNVSGTQFFYNAQAYTVDSYVDDPNSDLRIVKVTGTFSSWAPLYTAGTEANQPLVVFGRGTAPGSVVSGPAFGGGSETKGFQAGTADFVQSWGQNNVEGIFNGGAGAGPLLGFAFDRAGTVLRPSARPTVPNEASLTEFDSGGGLFVRDPADNVYKLAGINFGADGPYSLSADGSNPFRAAIYDRGGLWQEFGTGSGFITDQAVDQPGFSFATRVSGNLAFINANVPEPATAGVLLAAGAAGLLARRRRRPQ